MSETVFDVRVVPSIPGSVPEVSTEVVDARIAAALDAFVVDPDTMVDGTVNHVFTAADDTKLATIQTGATANDTDANLKNRANHTGTQDLDTTTDTGTRVAMTPAERTKLSGVATGATANSTDAQLRARSSHTGTQDLDTTTDSATRLAMTAAERTKLGTVATGASANSPDATLLARANHTGTQSADTIVDGTTNHTFTAADDTKLAGVATGATANSADATLLARANHTGTQSADTLTDGTTNKAYTAAEKTKLATVEARANHTGTQSADTLTDGTTNKAFLGSERTKLAGIASGATANDTDANLKARANHTGTQLASTVSDFDTQVKRASQRKFVCAWDDVADFNNFDEIAHSTQVTGSWTKSVSTKGTSTYVSSVGGIVQRARFAGAGTGTDGGNTRLLYPLKTSVLPAMVNSEITVPFVNSVGTGSGFGQGGMFFRMQQISSIWYAFVVWHDIVASNPRVLNFARWRCETSPGSGDSTTTHTGTGQWGFDNALNRPERIPILRSWRISNTAYYQLGTYDHDYIVGDLVNVAFSTFATFGAVAITYVSGDVIGISYSGVDSYAGGSGYTQNGNVPLPFPYTMKGTCTTNASGDTVIHAKIWDHIREREPSYDDNRYATRWVVPTAVNMSGAGRTGFFVGHLVVPNWTERGPITIESLDNT